MAYDQSLAVAERLDPKTLRWVAGKMREHSFDLTKFAGWNTPRHIAFWLELVAKEHEASCPGADAEGQERR